MEREKPEDLKDFIESLKRMKPDMEELEVLRVWLLNKANNMTNEEWEEIKKESKNDKMIGGENI